MFLYIVFYLAGFGYVFRKDFKMKKKFLYVLTLCFIMFSLTGCVKFNASMDIKANKSMDFSIIYAFDSSVFGDQSIVNNDDKANLESQGFAVNDYVDGNMKGITLSRNIKNIDLVSDSSDVQYNLSGLLGDNSNSNYVFKVKKGFLKNTYIANFNFDSSDSGLDMNNSVDDELYSDDIITGEDFSDDDQSDANNSVINGDSDFDLSGLTNSMSNMDLSFNVRLPYSAISSNATTTNNDNKDLSWSLSSDQLSTISFEFSLFNITNIALLCGGLLLFIIVLIVLLKGKKRKNKDSVPVEVDKSSVVPELNQINTPVQPFSEQNFNRQLMSQNQGVDTIVGQSNIDGSTPVSGVQQVSEVNQSFAQSNMLDVIPQLVPEVQSNIQSQVGVSVQPNMVGSTPLNDVQQVNAVNQIPVQPSVQSQVGLNVQPNIFEQQQIIDVNVAHPQAMGSVPTQSVEPVVDIIEPQVESVTEPIVDILEPAVNVEVGQSNVQTQNNNFGSVINQPQANSGVVDFNSNVSQPIQNGAEINMIPNSQFENIFGQSVDQSNVNNNGNVN